MGRSTEKVTPEYWIAEFKKLLAGGKGLEAWSGVGGSPAAAYMPSQGQALLEGDLLDELIERTCKNVPNRKDEGLTFCLDERGRDNATELLGSASGERKLEAQLFLEFLDCPPQELGTPIAYQLPLFEKAEKNGWGYIDILCYDTEENCPVVVELKRGDNSESPLRAVLEGLAYAIALRKGNWESIVKECRSRGLTRTDDLALIDDAGLTRVVVLAPSEYWSPWRDADSKSGKKDFFEDTPFDSLIEKLKSKHACEVAFMSVDHRPVLNTIPFQPGESST